MNQVQWTLCRWHKKREMQILWRSVQWYMWLECWRMWDTSFDALNSLQSLMTNICDNCDECSGFREERDALICAWRLLECCTKCWMTLWQHIHVGFKDNTRFIERPCQCVCADCFIVAFSLVSPEMVLQDGCVSPARSPDNRSLHSEKLCWRIVFFATEILLSSLIVLCTVWFVYRDPYQRKYA
jgi:hypothetical protein